MQELCWHNFSKALMRTVDFCDGMEHIPITSFW